MRWAFVALLLCGCSIFTKTPEAPVIVSNNEKKDAYIAKVEEVVSEATSALTAVAPALPVGIPKQIVEGQITRLSGISKPSVDKVKEFERIIKEQDKKAVDKDKEKASKVDAETDKLWALVEEQNEQIMLEQALRESAETEAKEERKTKLTLQASLACLGLLVFGVLVTAFAPMIFLKRAGVVIVVCAVLLEGLLLWYIS